MTTKFASGRGYLLVALLSFAVASLFCPGRQSVAAELKEDRISRETDRLRVLATEKFMELMAISPGMTILDIGTGTGQFAYLFAERLAGTGKVFATDVNESCISYVQGEAKRRGFNNIYPVLVEPEGVDEFYSRHRYDLITFFNVPIPNITAFLSGMRNYIAEDGRLIVVRSRVPAPFSPEDFGGQFPELIGELAREPEQSPFSKGLRDTTRQLIRRRNAHQPDDMVRQAILEDFNRMLSDARFTREFLNGTAMGKDVVFTPEEKYFAEFQLDILRESGLFDENPKELKPGKIRYLTRLNMLFFLQRFRKYLDAERLFVPVLDSATKDSFRRAGFRLEREEQALRAFMDVGVFRPDQRAEER